MPTVQALRKNDAAAPPPPRSPEREQLGQAIAKREATEQTLAKIAAALETASSASSETFRAAKRAKAAVEEVQENEGRFLAARALGGGTDASSVADAAAALEKAEVRHAASLKLVDALQVEQRTTEERLRWATQDVNDAASAVLRLSPELQQLQNDHEIARRSLAASSAKLVALMKAGAIRQVVWSIEELRPHEKPDPTWAAAIEMFRPRRAAAADMKFCSLA